MGTDASDSSDNVVVSSRLRNTLGAFGISNASIDRAVDQDRLHLLAVEAVVGPIEGRLSLNEIAERSAVDLPLLRTLWRSLGFADVGDDERVFTALDLDAAQALATLLSHGVDLEIVLQIARVIGSSMARVAEAEVVASALADLNIEGSETDNAETAEHFLRFASTMVPIVPDLLGYAWRRHLHSIATRYLLARDRGSFDSSKLALAVGFLDLVGFTVLSQSLTASELSTLVSEFEALAYDTVAKLGGRVVKMIGDEVMFVADDPMAAAEICLSLQEVYATQHTLSVVRAGLSYGTVLARGGDYFGTVVNLASRIVNIANPGSLLVSEGFRGALDVDSGYVTKALRPRYLKDFGDVQLWVLRRGLRDSESSPLSGSDR